jgi:hypothetical protein
LYHKPKETLAKSSTGINPNPSQSYNALWANQKHFKNPFSTWYPPTSWPQWTPQGQNQSWQQGWRGYFPYGNMSQQNPQ